MINNVKIEGSEVTIQLSGDGSYAFLSECLKFHCEANILATAIITNWQNLSVFERCDKVALINQWLSVPVSDSPCQSKPNSLPSAKTVSNPATRAGTTTPEGTNPPGSIDHIPGPLANPG